MSCNLSKYAIYNVGRVVHNNETGATTAQLIQPPASCPDQVFSSKKAKVQVVDGINPQLNFDQLQNRPVIMVPRAEYVEQVGSSGMGLGSLLLILAVLGMGAALIMMLIRRSQTPALAGSSGAGRSYGGPDYGSNPRLPSGPAPTQGGGTTVINNGSSNDGLLTGMMLGSMMSNNRSERVIERDTTIIERDSGSRDSNYSSDDDSSSSSSSSDDSYSSDSSSSDSSYSSDSSSDSSFSSDSGGSDFGSDS